MTVNNNGARPNGTDFRANLQQNIQNFSVLSEHEHLLYMIVFICVHAYVVCLFFLFYWGSLSIITRQFLVNR